jgi:hypothetical protein
MDTRAVPEIRPSRLRLPAIALALVLGLSLGPAPVQAAAPAGRFLGAVNDGPASVQTDIGAQATPADLNLVLHIGEGHTVTLSGLDLSAPGAPTGSGDSGTLTGLLKASATAPLADNGRFALALALSVHYPLIDSIFPPSPQPYFETFGGRLSGILTYDPGRATYRLEGTLHLSVRGAATKKVLSIDLLLQDVELRPDGKEASR